MRNELINIGECVCKGAKRVFNYLRVQYLSVVQTQRDPFSLQQLPTGAQQLGKLLRSHLASHRMQAICITTRSIWQFLSHLEAIVLSTRHSTRVWRQQTDRGELTRRAQGI